MAGTFALVGILLREDLDSIGEKIDDPGAIRELLDHARGLLTGLMEIATTAVQEEAVE